MDTFIGIDIGKATYVVALLQGEQVQRAEFPNTTKGHKHLLRWFKRANLTSGAVCMEATGRYWESVAEFLYAAHFTVHVVNPAQVKAFRAHIQHDPDLKRNLDLLISIPGIAEATAARIMAEIGDGTLFSSADQLAAYIGVHPANFTSGTSVHAHPRMSKAGNARLRKALYLPAIAARSCNPRVKALTLRLEAKGRAKMEIIGAAMHKLARIVFGVLHAQQPFCPLYP